MMPDAVPLGTLLMVLGLGFGALTLVAARFLTGRHRTAAPEVDWSSALSGVEKHQDAVLVVEPGGRILYVNTQVQEWFGLEEPSLERYARRTRPSEAFLGVCATESQARFFVAGKLVEASSHLVPHPTLGKVMVVSMRRPRIAAVTGGQGGASGQTIEMLAELSQSMAASLDLDTTLRAILDGVEHLISSDFAEITVWDPDKRHLVPYRFVGTATGEQRMERTDQRYNAEDGYSGYLIRERKILRVADVDTFRDAHPVVDRRRYPFRSYLGVPLLVGGELVGTLELAAIEPDAFSQADEDALQMLAGQAAIALHNAILFREERRQSLELSGLAHLARVTASIRDTEDLFSRLIESITPLFEVEILGVLLYDDFRRRLAGQSPFIGLPDDFLALYQVEIPSDSEAEGVLLSQNLIVAQEPASHPDLRALGLHHIAQASGMRQTVLAPLTAGGRVLGYLQIANKRDGTAFEDDDIRLISIVAAQVGPLLENVSLLQESRRRAQRSDALRRIASLAGSAATLDEILKFSLQELVRQAQADVGVIFLLDEPSGVLQIHEASLFGIEPEKLPPPRRVFMDSSQYHATVTGQGRHMLWAQAGESETADSPYRSILQGLDAQSLLGVPLVVRDRSVGEVLLFSRRQSQFDEAALLFVSTAAGQLAGAVERAFLYSQTDETLRRRVEELSALTRISRELNITLDLQHILQRVLEESLRATHSDEGTIVLFEMGEDGEVLSNRMRLYVGAEPHTWLSEVVSTVSNLSNALAIDSYASSSLPRPSARAQSGLLAPVVFQEQVAGFLYIWSEHNGGGYDSVDVETAQALAVQAAIALGNALRYQEQTRRNEMLNRRMETVSKLLEAVQAQDINQPLEASLEAIAYAIQESTSFNMVLISVYEPQGGYLRRVAGAGFTIEEMEELKMHTQPWDSVSQYFKPEFQLAGSYFIPEEKMPVTPPDVHAIYPSHIVAPPADKQENAWKPDDVFITPLKSASGEPLGVISVDNPRDGLRPDWPAIETLEIFAGQAALTIERHQRLRALQGELQNVERRYERARHLSKVAQKHLPFLLHKDVEQTLALYQVGNHARRVRAGLDIAALVNQQPDRQTVFRTLAEEVLLRMEMDIVLIAEQTPDGPNLVQVLGAVPPHVTPQALFGQANPLRHTLQSGEVIMVADLARQKTWHDSPLIRQLEARSFVSIPVIVNQISPEAAVLMLSRSPLSGFVPEDEQLYALLGRQVGLTLQNLNLLTETSQRLREVNLLLEFSRQLGGLESENILRTLMETALQVATQAAAGQILLWDEQQRSLRPHSVSRMADAEKAMQIVYPLETSLPGQVFRTGRIQRVGRLDFAEAYQLAPDDLIRYRDATAGKLPVSSLLVPIQSGERKWGVLVLDNYTENDAFGLEDQALIHSLTQQAALALENARLYQTTEQKARQLQALTTASGALSASLERADALVESLLGHLASIVPYDTATLWLRDGDRLTIRAVRGFVDSDERLGISVAVEDSRLFQEMMLTQRPIAVGDVVADERFPAWDEAPYLSWLGVPLVSKGDLKGVIALEKVERDYYASDDVQIAATFATQAAIVLENASLLGESMRRAEELAERSQRLALLNQLSSELSASLDVDEILRIAIDELFEALHTSSTLVVLFNQADDAPVLWMESPPKDTPLPMALPDAPLFSRIREGRGVFNAENAVQEEDLAPLLPLLEERGVHSLLAVPMISGTRVHGVLFACESRRSHRFTADEIELALTISNQAAIALQNARLYEETQSRLNEISVIYRVSQALTATIDLDELLKQLPEQLSAIVDTRNIYLALYDKTRDMITFSLAQEEGQQVQAAPQPARGLTGHIIATRNPLLLTGEAGQETMRTLQPLKVGVKQAASYLGVPLLAGDEVIGVLAVQDPDDPYAYTENDLRLLTTVAAQLAVTIQNSRLFTETRQRSADLSLLFEFGNRIANELDEEKLVEITFEVLSNALQVNTIGLLVVDEFGTLKANLLDAGERLQDIEVPQDGSSLSEYILQTGEPLLVGDLHNPDMPLPVEGYDVGAPVRSWVGVPLIARGKPIGVLSIQDSLPERFSMRHERLLTQVAGQLATALDNAHLFAQVQNYAEQLEHRVAERTQELAREHQRTETLLRIITELSASLDMDIVLNRTLSLINQIVGAEQSTIMLVDAAENTLVRRASRGYTEPVTEGGERSAIKPNEGLAGWVIRHREPVLLADVTQDPRWVENPNFPTQHRSTLVVPLMVGEEALGALMLFHREPNRFSDTQLDLVAATAKQIAVAVNNANLYRLIADQAERLGDMLRKQHIEASRSQAILEAVADGVLVTDNGGTVTLFNASAERILRLPREQVLDKSLEHFSGLFGKAAHDWMNTIREWSANPEAYSNEDIYAEQVDLDDGRVVSVHLSPVLLRNEFLGTVSIFRDITHQVEVDRLKSEFVANVSHELRTPMTSIKGYVDIMLMGAAGKLSDQQTNFLEVIKSNTDRMITLVNDLLNISQMETGRIELDIVPLDVRPVLEAAISRVRLMAEKENREMSLALDLPDALPLVLADSDRLEQIVQNLVDNAYHYTPAGGHIWVSAHLEGDYLQVDVRDDGIGIPPEEQERVFERFYRGEDTLVIETAGTGLGLSIVQNLVEMHGGRIWVTSEGVPGAGSVFSFTIPLYREDSAQTLEPSTEAQMR